MDLPASPRFVVKRSIKVPIFEIIFTFLSSSCDMGLLHHYWWVMILLVVIELRFYSSNSQNLTCHPRELEALRDFINEVDSKPDGWDFNSTGDCCEWEGMHMLFFASLKRSGQEDTENHQAEDCPVSCLNLLGGCISLEFLISRAISSLAPSLDLFSISQT